MSDFEPVDDQSLDIAIIGMVGRFPGADNVDSFWRNLCEGVESIAAFSDADLLALGVDSAVLQHPHFVKSGAILKQIDLFDASFFGYSPREAELMDPQHRIFLEAAWEALEHAGYSPERYDGLIGVYAGMSMSTYLLFNLLANADLQEDSFQVMIGTDKDFLGTRVSYKLNLKGPSLDIQTGCSTSLVAVQMACQGLLNYHCDMALVGGISVHMPQRTGYYYQEGGIASPDGHCRAFDKNAQGTVFGSGLGIVVLKRLSDAITDGDRIVAVIKGAAINNDGAAKIGYTAPSIEGQAEVIARALAVADIDPRTIGYIETHGTGTVLGDPIEVEALNRVFARHKGPALQRCAIGSVKANIGHLDAAAGVAGLIKTALALHHRQIPPSINCEEPNPKIDWDQSACYVNTTLLPWEAGATPRRAGVSSFGIGGTNAHVILEEAPPVPPSGAGRPWQLLLLSARTSTALDTATLNLAQHLEQNPAIPLADVAYTLQVGRKVFNHRRMVLCQGHEDALAALTTHNPQRVSTLYQEPSERQIVFMFPGGGAQYVEMGRDLYRDETIFRNTVDRCAELLRPMLGYDLRAFLYPDAERSEQLAEQFKRTSLALPALFVIEYALAQQLMAWGIKPQALIGHSVGEYAAACLAGVFSLADALALVTLRGRLFEQLPHGTMLSVSLPPDELDHLLNDCLALAAVNGAALCVVAGPVEEIERLSTDLAAREIEFRRIHIDVAAHSPMVQPILPEFTAFVQRLTLREPQIPFISNVSGTWITPAEATDPQYWTRHLRQTVQFSAGLQTLLHNDTSVLLEVGPGQTLSALARLLAGSDRAGAVLATMRHPYDKKSDQACLLAALGQLWLLNCPIDWAGFYTHERRYRAALPAYPFEQQSFWIAPDPLAAEPTRRRNGMARHELDQWFSIPAWRRVSLVPAPADSGISTWLVFLDTSGVGSALVERLRHAGQRVATVQAGRAFQHAGEAWYMLDPRQPEQYGQLLADLRERGSFPERIVHLWNVAPHISPEASGPPGANGHDDPIASAIAECEQTLDLSFYSLLALAQALGQHGEAQPVQIEVISSSMQDVAGDELVDPARATLLGPCRVIPKEYPHISCRSIDITLSQAGVIRPDLIERLWAELTSPITDPIVAYRGSYRWCQVFEPIALSRPAERPPKLRERGVYVITGGLGGIGLVLAEYLAQTFQARLILTGRSVLPPREQWAQWLSSHADADPDSRKIRHIKHLEALGADVLVVAGDVTQPAAMRMVIAEGIRAFGTIHGVIHAAGVPPGGMIQTKTPDAARQILAPKVTGAIVLEALLREQPLDFLLLCSSLTAILGELGQADHCAANAFLDAFASRAGRTAATPVIAVNWDTWQEVGQAVTTPVAVELQAWRAKTLEAGIRPSEGVEVFQRALACPTPQLIVSTRDLSAVIAQYKTLTIDRLLATLAEGSGRLVHQRPALAENYTAPSNPLEEAIAAIWQQVLGIAQVGVDDNFFELGGSSLIGIRVVAEIKRALQIEVSIVNLFEGPTVRLLAQHIGEQQPAKTYDHRRSRGERRRERRLQQLET